VDALTVEGRRGLDSLKYWAIAERDIEIQNPVTDRKLRLLEDYCDLRDGLRVLDIGCGKAWLMRQWADRFAIDGVGIDINARFLEVARRLTPARGKLTFHNAAARDVRTEPESFDIVLCLGASFAIGELPEAIEWMVAATKPGGRVVIGDIVLKHPPAVPKHEVLPPDTLSMIGIVDRHGCDVSATISASEADFERYASHHRHNTVTWARENPDHPDHAAVMEKSQADWMHFQRTIRPMLGWTIVVGRKRG